MAVVELFIENRKVDLSEDIASDVTYSLADIRTPDKRQVNFSKTLTLVGTLNNNYLFGNIFDVDVENEIDAALPNVGVNYTPKKYAAAKMFSDGIEVFNGVLRLWSATKKDNVIFYDVSLFGKLFDIFGEMGDARLQDLDFSEMNHTATWPNIQATWSPTFTGGYRYPLIDWGINVNNLSGQPDTLKIGSINPAIHYTKYIDKIFSSIGSSYELRFSDTSILNKLIVTGTRGGINAKPNLFSSTFTGTADFEASGVGAFQTFNFIPIISTVTRDINGMIVGGDKTRLQITSNVTTSFQFKINFRHFVGEDGLNSISIIRIRSSISTILASFNQRTEDVPDEDQSITLEVPKQDFQAGDVIHVRISLTRGSLFRTKPGSTVKAASPIDNAEYQITYGDDVSVNSCVPTDIKQVDFIKDFIKMFNLYFVTDKENDKKFIFTPHIDFYERDKTKAKNWSSKIDFEDQIVITPIAFLAARDYVLTWKNDKDFWTNKYFEENKEVYGQVTYKADTDVFTNSQKVEMLFSPAVMTRFESSSVLCPAIYKVDTSGGTSVRKPDKFNARLLIWGGLKDAGHNIKLLNSIGATVATVTQYPYAGHIDDPIAPTFDLNFGNTNSSIPTASVNTFSKYWGKLLRESSDKDGKLMSCTMLLKPEDIEALEFASLYKVGDQFYRLNKIEGYNAFKLQTCKVELIKVINL